MQQTFIYWIPHFLPLLVLAFNALLSQSISLSLLLPCNYGAVYTFYYRRSSKGKTQYKCCCCWCFLGFLNLSREQWGSWISPPPLLSIAFIFFFFMENSIKTDSFFQKDCRKYFCNDKWKNVLLLFRISLRHYTLEYVYQNNLYINLYIKHTKRRT